uniref:Uncharacterized protein n=1 Tax=Salix viminalis TaxID=40686 RepID=A0A6N2NC70_SALVM
MRPDFFIDLVCSITSSSVEVASAICSFSFGSKFQAFHSLLEIVIWFVIRLYLIFPSNSEIIKATRVVTETAWAGAAYNLLLYMLASHARNASLNREIH